MHNKAEHQRTGTYAPPSVGATAKLSPVPFERIDDYVVVARLGQGGMAEVFLALSVGPSGFRKLVAIKRLYKHMQNDAAAVDLFLAEAALAARLQHANVVQTHKVGTFQGQHFIAMEYLDGQPLNRVLNRLRSQESRMPAPLAAQFISDAREGLHYAHEAKDYDGTPMGVIHRDVSPHNIFITFDGQVKLLDFGIAQQADAVDRTALSRIINGKFAYMAPEQALGEYIDRRADIWGMGITLWECLAGQRLFRGCNEVTVMQSSLTEDIPWVTDIAPDVPEALARIVDKALQRDPYRRYATALKFKEELDLWLATQQSTRSKGTVSSTMRSLFSDTIERRRDTLRDCLARVDGADTSSVDSTPSTAARPTTVAPSLPPPLPVRAEPPETWLRAALPRVAAFGTGGLIALVIGLLLTRGKAEGEAHATAMPPPASKVAAAQQAQPAPEQPVQAESPRAPEALLPTTPTAPPTLNANAPESSPIRHVSSRHSAARNGSSERSAAVEVGEFVPEPMVPATPEPAAEAAAIKTGHLLLDSTPYAVVMLNGKRLGITPIDVELPAATHSLILRNPERGIETPYLVTIPAGESIRRRVALE